MNAFVRFITPDGRVVELGSGDVIGRTATSALRLDDPRISEAHALVSLRAEELKLLALRGRFSTPAKANATEVVLKPGLVIRFTPDLALTVAVVALPPTLAALEGDAFPRQVLPPVASLFAARGELVPGFAADADALFWSTGERFRMRLQGERDVDIAAGTTFVAAGRSFRCVELALARAGVETTAVDEQADQPLRLVLRYDTVHVHRGNEATHIDGVPAQIICELALVRGPIEWRALARELWGDRADDEALRDRWDGALARLRKRLRDLRLRPDLVRTDGRGRVELFLQPRDRVEDET